VPKISAIQQSTLEPRVIARSVSLDITRFEVTLNLEQLVNNARWLAPFLSRGQDYGGQHDKPSHNDQRGDCPGSYFSFLFCGVTAHSMTL
jgi:hypothetical protein